MSEELNQLREEVAKLRERVAVLEAKQRPMQFVGKPVGDMPANMPGLPSQWPVYEPYKPTPWEPHLSKFGTTCQS